MQTGHTVELSRAYIDNVVPLKTNPLIEVAGAAEWRRKKWEARLTWASICFAAGALVQ